MQLNNGKPGSLDLFNSSDYKCDKTGNTNATDVIFMDENNGFTFINESIEQEKIESKNYFKTYNVCHTLEPKPSAKFCVSSSVEYGHCLNMKRAFEENTKVSLTAHCK